LPFLRLIFALPSRCSCLCGVDLIRDAPPFGRLWYDTPDHAIGYAQHHSRSHDAVIRDYDATGNVIKTDEHKGDFKEF